MKKIADEKGKALEELLYKEEGGILRYNLVMLIGNSIKKTGLITMELSSMAMEVALRSINSGLSAAQPLLQIISGLEPLLAHVMGIATSTQAIGRGVINAVWSTGQDVARGALNLGRGALELATSPLPSLELPPPPAYKPYDELYMRCGSFDSLKSNTDESTSHFDMLNNIEGAIKSDKHKFLIQSMNNIFKDIKFNISFFKFIISKPKIP